MKGPDDFRCPICETPTRGGRICDICRDEDPICRHCGKAHDRRYDCD